MGTTRDEMARAITEALTSPNVSDSNGETANVVDALAGIACSARTIADAITPRAAAGGTDAFGGHVESLTEAIMGMTKGLDSIAGSLSEVADAIRAIGRTMR